MNTINKALLAIAAIITILGNTTSKIRAGEQPYHRQALSNLHVNDIVQDELGFVWIGTANGLSRCNGLQGYNIYFNDAHNLESLPNNHITGLKISSGKLWVASYGGVASKPTGKNNFTRYTIAGNEPDNLTMNGFIEHNSQLLCYGAKGVYEIDTLEHKLYRRIASEKNVHAVMQDQNGMLWTADDGKLTCCNNRLKPVITTKLPEGITVNSMLKHGSIVLVATDNGILRLDINSGALQRSPLDANLNNERVYSITPLQNGILLACTSTSGLIAYNPDNGSLVNHVNGKKLDNDLSTDVTTTFIDRDQNLWIGTFDNGYRIVPHRQPIFNSDKNLCNAFKGEFVTRIATDQQQRLWIGTRYNGIVRFDPESGKTHRFNRNNTPWLSNSPQDFTQEIFCDSQNRLWIGYNNDLTVCQVQSDGSLTHLRTFPSVTDVVTVAEDPNGQIWVGLARNGMNVYSKNIESVCNISLPHADNVTCIKCYDNRHMIFSAYGSGLYLVDTQTYHPAPFDRTYTAPCVSAIDILLASDGQLWIGTYGNGVFCYNPTNHTLQHPSGFMSDDIVGILEGSDNELFFSSSYGLYRYNTKNGKLTTYMEAQGTIGNQYHEKSRMADQYGNLYFGGNSGLQQISPVNMRQQTTPAKLYLTNVEILNNPDKKNTHNYCPDYSTVHKMSLNHKKNSVRMEFAGLNYDAPLDYAYKLEGFDKDWIISGEHNQALYSNLPAGKYRLLVKSRTDDVWSEPTELLQLNINPSPWLHPMAKIAYILIIIMLIILFNHMYLRIRLERRRYMMAEEQVLKERDSTQRKINFFNNLSHEIRTPVSLIYAPVKFLRNNISTLPNQKVEATLDYIDRNVDRLLNLTNQLLKFHEVQQDTLPLKVGRYDCVAQLESIVRIYNIYAAEKGQSVEFVSSYKSYECTYDYDKLEKITNNLLFNATKYTPENGHIIVKLEITKLPEGFDKATDHNYMEIQVIDDGIGMPESEVPRLFQRFQRLLAKNSEKKINGYGVGLSYVKELVACHKGTITPRKNPVKGMTFIVAIPVDDSAFSPEEHKESADIKDIEQLRYAVDDEIIDISETERLRILLVEDNEELLEFEANIFRGKYEVLTANNGQEGLDIARKEMPNVIISDIVMPQMDGYELCRHIKSDMDTCHISVILLTAKTLDEDRITGYKVGADMYIDKPFNPEVLQSMVEGLIVRQERNRIHALEVVGESPERVEKEEELNPLDRKFLSKLYAYINENMSNSELNVNILGKDLGFSRTNFYRKIKMLTGVTPNDLLRMCRLNKAAELLLTKQHTIGEISDICGFGTQSHFSSLFKKHFGVSPRDYVGGGPRE
ncbi:MAG: response regulator [Muribaculum sp.]|nr:response regulator [Muribaculaceae bacterium]MCM1080728.1 response regulator [Muribaculum sp.]